MTKPEEIKEKLGILEVVESYIKLERSGKNYRAKSPFTNEKTPSFFVVPDKNFFHCFSSGKGGDIFTFVMEMERIDFREALKILAERAGVSLDTYDTDRSDERARAMAVMSDAINFYQHNLGKTEEVKDYLKGRGIVRDSVIMFKIGYAGDGEDTLCKFLRARKHTQDDIIASGVCALRAGRVYDRFRERIMFPIHDRAGKPVGFSGRIFTLANSRTDTGKIGKYVNTAETILYHKSEILYGLHHGRDAARTSEKIIIVEGQMDVIMSHQVGVKNVVGLSGTTLSDFQIREIKRISDHVIFGMDMDTAGQIAMEKNARVCLQNNVDVSVLDFTGANDPADIIMDAPEKWSAIVTSPVPLFQYLFQKVSTESATNKRQAVMEKIFPMIAALQSEIRKEEVLADVASFLNVSVEAVKRDFDEFASATDDTMTFITDHVDNQSDRKTAKIVLAEKMRGVLMWQNEIEDSDRKLDTQDLEKLKNTLDEHHKIFGTGEVENNNDILILHAEYDTIGQNLSDIKNIVREGILRLEIEIMTEAAHKLSQRIKEREDMDEDVQDLVREHSEIINKITEKKQSINF